MDKILIKNLKLFGYHGYGPREREAGQLFIIDVELEGDFSSAQDLSQTVDYSEVIERIREINAANNFLLIESFAQEIACSILESFPRVQRVKAKVKKRPPQPVGISLGYVAAEVIKERGAASGATSAIP